MPITYKVELNYHIQILFMNNNNINITIQERTKN